MPLVDKYEVNFSNDIFRKLGMNNMQHLNQTLIKNALNLEKLLKLLQKDKRFTSSNYKSHSKIKFLITYRSDLQDSFYSSNTSLNMSSGDINRSSDQSFEQ